MSTGSFTKRLRLIRTAARAHERDLAQLGKIAEADIAQRLMMTAGSGR